mmetsp:Transcript_25983/g.61786  ORF Transcript_25983/g.61786 Transcript_25983/m.61786 type:complete len:278 (+) Transcript_25983:177-1010(+)
MPVKKDSSRRRETSSLSSRSRKVETLISFSEDEFEPPRSERQETKQRDAKARRAGWGTGRGSPDSDASISISDISGSTEIDVGSGHQPPGKGPPRNGAPPVGRAAAPHVEMSSDLSISGSISISGSSGSAAVPLLGSATSPPPIPRTTVSRTNGPRGREEGGGHSLLTPRLLSSLSPASLCPSRPHSHLPCRCHRPPLPPLSEGPSSSPSIDRLQRCSLAAARLPPSGFLVARAEASSPTPSLGLTRWPPFIPRWATTGASRQHGPAGRKTRDRPPR